MGVYSPSLTNISLNTTIQNYGALNYWYVTHNSGTKSLGNMNTNGPQNVDSQSNLAMKGTSSTNGFLSYNGTNVTTSRFLLLTGTNCNVGVSYPSSNQGVVWKSGSTPIYNRTYITSSETSQGYKFYTRGVRHNDYSYMTVYAYSFSYGYSTGSWIWYNSNGSFVTSFGSGTTSQTLYSYQWTSMSNNYELRHVAS